MLYLSFPQPALCSAYRFPCLPHLKPCASSCLTSEACLVERVSEMINSRSGLKCKSSGKWKQKSVQNHVVLMPLAQKPFTRIKPVVAFRSSPSASCLSFSLAANTAPTKWRYVLLPSPAQAAASRYCILPSHSKDCTARERGQTRISSWQGAAQGQLDRSAARGAARPPATHPASHFSSLSQALSGLCILLPDGAILIHLTLPDWDCCLKLVNCPGTSLQDSQEAAYMQGLHAGTICIAEQQGHLTRLIQQLAECR